MKIYTVTLSAEDLELLLSGLVLIDHDRTESLERELLAIKPDKVAGPWESDNPEQYGKRFYRKSIGRSGGFPALPGFHPMVAGCVHEKASLVDSDGTTDPPGPIWFDPDGEPLGAETLEHGRQLVDEALVADGWVLEDSE